MIMENMSYDLAWNVSGHMNSAPCRSYIIMPWLVEEYYERKLSLSIFQHLISERIIDGWLELMI